MDNFQPPLVSGPEPNLLDRARQALRNIRSAIAAQRARRPVKQAGEISDVRPGLRAGRKGQQDRRPRHSDPPRPKHPTDYGAKTWEKITAFVLIAPWTAFLFFPVAADYLGDPRTAIAGLAARYPILEAVELYARAALWQAPLVALATFGLRLLALAKTFQNGLNAGGIFVIAMLIDGAAWFIWGRDHLPVSGLSPAEQTAAGHLMIVFAVYSLSVWGLFGPPPTKRTGTTGFD